MKYLIAACILMLGANVMAKTASPLLSPSNVVIPSLAGDPASADRLVGQLYFDVSTAAFKGIDNNGNVQIFATSSSSVGNGAKVAPAAVTLSGGWLDVVFTNADAMYDTSSFIGTNVFVAQHTGIHAISFFANGAADSTSLLAQFQVNSGTWYTFCGTMGATGIYPKCTVTESVYLTAGDTVKFQVTGNTPNANGIRISITEQRY